MRNTPRHWLRLFIAGLVVLSAPRAVYETRRLLFGQTWYDATDIKNFHKLAVTWLSGQDVFATVANADYPPASYPLMYAMYGLDPDVNRWVWFSHAVVVLGLLIWMCVRESGAESPEERLCVALIPLAMYSTGVAFGNGQLVIHALTASTAAILLLYRSRGRLAWELGAAACMLFALVKPNLTAPFFWLFLLIPRRKHAAVFVLVGYALLTVLGASVQPASLVDQFRGFLSNGLEVTGRQIGYGAVPLGLMQAGLPDLILPFTLAALAAMGIWVWVSRDADHWLLYGGLAIMSRLWAYHQLYDDVLNLFALIALIRLVKGHAGNLKPDQMALFVLLIGLTTLPGPATPLRFDRGWISVVDRGWQTAVRCLMLIFIMHRTWMQRRQAVRRPAFLR